MKKKLLMSAVSASLLAFLPATAHAAINLIPGQTTVSAAENAAKTSISFDDNAIVTGSFTERLSFSLDAASNVIFNYGTTFAAIDFTDAFVTALNSDTRLFTLPGFAGNPNPENLAGSFDFGAGAYTLTTIGTNSAAGSNGTLGGTVSATVLPAVPEPSTWAMMLIGFGAVGFGLRRRKGEGKTARVRVAYA